MTKKSYILFTTNAFNKKFTETFFEEEILSDQGV